MSFARRSLPGLERIEEHPRCVRGAAEGLKAAEPATIGRVTLDDHVPRLLARARRLLSLPGGPQDELAKAEVSKAAAAVSRLHDGLIGERSAQYEGATLGAYLLWFWPQTYEKVASILRMFEPPRAPRILDLGAGPAPAAIAALDALGGEALAFDASEPALNEARALDPRLRTQTGDLARGLPEGEFELVLAANVLVEQAFAFRPSGTLVLIEPALRDTGRALLQTRDRLLSEGWFAHAPCLTQKPCPALLSAKDWCTIESVWTPPRYFQQLATATGLRADEVLSFAAVVLSRTKPQSKPGASRVVGLAPPEKGKRRVWVCNDDGRLPAVLLDRDASEDNALFTELRRGDLVQLGKVEPRGDGLRLGKDSKVCRG
jgi:ribosomal protein RSM22 (predicted rRNA methylase)